MRNSRRLCSLVIGLLLIGAETRPAVGEVLDLNAVSAAQLEALPGLGRHRAELIVRVRGRNSPFRSLSELRALPRFTWKMIDRLRPYLRVRLETPPEETTPDAETRRSKPRRSPR